MEAPQTFSELLQHLKVTKSRCLGVPLFPGRGRSACVLLRLMLQQDSGRFSAQRKIYEVWCYCLCYYCLCLHKGINRQGKGWNAQRQGASKWKFHLTLECLQPILFSKHSHLRVTQFYSQAPVTTSG